MEFKFYDEVDPDQVNDIMLICHGEPAGRRLVDKIRRTDPFCSPWFRMYAVENDQVISQVGATYPIIETTQGKMKIGYVEGVATMPSHARKGVARKLMLKVHEQMMEDDVELFFLGASLTGVAPALYSKLGYHVIGEYDWGMKKHQTYPRNDVTMKIRRHKIDDGNKLFRKYSKGKLGFIHRPDDYPKKKSTWGAFYQKTVTFYRNEKPIGYALIRPMGEFLSIRELVCPNDKDFTPCLQSLENYYKKSNFVTRSLVGPATDLTKKYEDHGFRSMETWGVHMAMDPKGKMSQKQVEKLLGIDKNMFQIFMMDTY
ncbi:MAG: GNAT family N-acetyltransferase [Thermoplasmata archaeon]|nr:GNAT family N-acetyltransferase [Thermoplasmata archaeon]